jgi:KDO2-lipid IV(A) lauroyltransferase
MVDRLRRLLLKTPQGARDWVADRAGDLSFRVMGKSRRNVLANVRRATAARDDGELRTIARQVFRTAARNLIDLALLPAVDVVELQRSVRVTDGTWDRLESLKDRRGGLIVVTAHLGPFDQIPAILAGRGIRLMALTTRTTGRRRFSLWTGLRRAHGIGVEEPSRTVLRNLLVHLEGGGTVGLVADCDLDGGGEPFDFFGERTSLPTVMVRLARQTGSPVVPVFVRRAAEGYAISIEEPLAVQATTDRADDLRRGMERVVAELQRAIARSPEQWVIFQQVWPDERLGAEQ